MKASRSSASKRRAVRVFDLQDNPLDSAELSLAALLCVGLLAGGGGVGAAFGNLAVQLIALGCLAFNRAQVAAFVSDSPAYLRWLLALTLALPLVQLVPLPPFIWQALPGRSLVVEATSLIGAQDDWRPFTVDAAATLTSALSLLPPVTAIVLMSGLSRTKTVRILLLVTLLALVHIAMGAIQLSTGNQYGNPYPGSSANVLYGSFANRNSTGIFFTVAMLATVAAFAGTDWLETRLLASKGGLLLVGISLLFGISAALTQSRSSTVLFGLVILVLAVYRILQRPGSAAVASPSSERAGGRSIGELLSLGALAALIGAIAIVGSGKFGQTASRFAEMDGTRVQIWSDAMGSVRRFWPLGSGVGTFDQVFQVDEQLENLSALKAGRAHNDFIEIVIESGIVGLGLVLAWIVWGCRQALLSRNKADAAQRLAAVLGLIVIGLQSLVDYPLRNEAMLCIAALMIALLGRRASERKSASDPAANSTPGAILAGSR